jgi:hypothetical protein
MPLLFLLGTRWGMVGVACAWIVGYSAIVGALFLRQVLQLLQLSLARYLRALLPAAVATAVMIAVVLLLRRAVSLEPGSAGRLLLDVGAGAASYATTLGLTHARRLRSLRELLREALRGGDTPSPVPADLPALRGEMPARGLEG